MLEERFFAKDFAEEDSIFIKLSSTIVPLKNHDQFIFLILRLFLLKKTLSNDSPNNVKAEPA